MTNPRSTPEQGGATEEQIEAAARAEAERRYVPLDRPTAISEQCAVQGFVDGAKWSASASAHPADEPHDADDQVRGEAIREVAEHLDRTLKSGLVAKFYVLSTMEAAASRMERGMNAHGDVRQPRPEPRDSADDSLAAAFEQMRDEYDGYRHAVRVGVQRVRDVAARVQVATASEVLESLAYIGMPPELVPTRMIGERHDAEEREAESEDHAATVTGGDERDRAMEIAQALAQAHTFTTVSALSIANAALALATPVEVDEAKLAEVIESSAAEWGDSARVQSVLAQYIARSVTESLRGEGQ